jgi:ferritin-like metal-binding protein YciE
MATVALENRLEEKVIDYLQDAHAMETSVLRMLDSMISTTNDPEVHHQLKWHRMDTERHGKMLRERLEALGQSVSLSEEVPAVLGAWLKALADKLRSDKPSKNARDGFVTEHLEIAAYSLLERLAKRAGDLETARVARFIRDDEEEMARWITSHWDRFIDLTLEEGGIEVPRHRSSNFGWSQERVQRWGRRQPPRTYYRWPGIRVLALAGIGVAGFLLVRWIGKQSSSSM